ncbi:MAG: hypothetical protein Q3M24_20815 [Candidatus Electrothrix aestuarii]|uniref:Tetratricopeptide repeat-containing protein n=1 Tax=Candidatus Electrothrix aestuarii TaxID=3062594 RepID=A0AAU8LV06_9BACT|nr:hypothetical protein [Candidatus Electrothrix aestuarii]
MNVTVYKRITFLERGEGMGKVSFWIIVFAIINVPIVSAEKVSHPPTYEQMKEAIKEDESFDTDLYEALQYTSEDIQRLKNTGNIQYIIAAASQLHGSERISLLVEHLKDVEKNILGLSLLITTLLHEDEIRKTPSIEGLIQKLKELSPNNGYPYYLRAYYYARKGDTDFCIKYTKQATQYPVFNNYEVELSENSIAGSIFLGYSKLAAQIHALVPQNDIFLYYKLAQYILKNSSDNKADILLCLEMGKILQAASTTVISDYISIAILKKTFEALKTYQETKGNLSSLNKLKERLTILTECSKKISTNSDISETRWVEHYDELYAVSEQSAMKKLIADYPATIALDGKLIDCISQVAQ